MGRTQFVVRDAVSTDASDVAALWRGLMGHAGAADWGVPAVSTAHEAIGRHLDDPDARVLVATVNGAVAGCAFVHASLVSPVQAERVVHLSHLEVAGTQPKPEVSAALVEEAVTWAESRGGARLLVSSRNVDRDFNRLLARFGLGQVGVIRSGSVASLRARMPSKTRSVSAANRNVGQVVALRRQQRRTRSVS